MLPALFMSRIIDVDPITGLTMTFRYDHATDQTVIGYSQDCTRIIDDNKRAQIENDAAAQLKGEWMHAARVPTIVQMEWLTKYGVNFHRRDHESKWKALINSPDYKYLKRVDVKI